MSDAAVLLGEGFPAVMLLAPRVRYANAASAPGRAKSIKTLWRAAAEGDSRWSDGQLTLQLIARPRLGTGDIPVNATLNLTAAAETPVRVGVCAIRLAVPSGERPWFLDSDLEWKPLLQDTAIGDFTPFRVQFGGPGDWWILESQAGSVPSRLRWKAKQLEIELYIDAAALHPRRRDTPGQVGSAAAPDWTPDQVLELRLRLSHLPVSHLPRDAARATGGSATPVLLSRYPAGAEASFVITDHCDFDRVNLLRVFLEGDGEHKGWLGRGLRLTKGVFARPGEPEIPGAAPTLLNPDYCALLARLRAEDSEIAPHSLSERGDLDPTPFEELLSRTTAEWGCRTWIDHGGTQSYTYVMGGATSDHRLLENLRKLGYCAIWSYYDSPLNSAVTLNLLRPVRRARLRVILLALGHLSAGRVTVALHYLRSVLRSSSPSALGLAFNHSISLLRRFVMATLTGRPFSKDERARQFRIHRRYWKRVFQKEAAVERLPYSLQEWNELSPTVYPERGAPLREASATDLMLFNTQELLHVQDACTPGALDQLIQERGLHIAHTYLLNTLPYVRGVFRHGGSAGGFAPAWVRFLEHFERRVREGRLWNPTMSDLADWMRDWQQIAVRRGGDASVRIRNPFITPVGGATVLLPRDTDSATIVWGEGPPTGTRRWRDWLAVWGDLPAGEEILVRWA